MAFPSWLGMTGAPVTARRRIGCPDESDDDVDEGAEFYRRAGTGTTGPAFN